MGVRTEQVRVTADVNNFTTKMATASGAAKAFVKDLESSNSRMENLVQTGLALGPALVPIGAVAVPAIAALTSELGLAVLATGTAIAAFKGIGDTLDAVTKYKIDPTTENLDNLQDKLRELGPAGREFVVFLHDIEPRFQRLQGLARNGLFPGVEDGIEHVLHLMPRVRALVSTVSEISGGIAANVGDSLDSPFWRDFIDFLGDNARTELVDLSKTIGHVTTGLAALWEAFDPMNDEIASGLESMTLDFQKWAKGLDETEGFQSFMDYVRDTGPQVMTTLGDLSIALLDIVKAAAPLGGPSLQILSAIANTLSAIANSPAGPVLIGAAAGLSAISRAIALYKVVNGSALVTQLTKLSTIDQAGIRAMPTNLLKVTSAQERAMLSAKDLSVMEYQRSKNVRAGMANLGKASASAAGLALLMTDVDDGFALSNTAALGLMGTMAGPWGAAIGAGTGFALDLAAANDKLEESLKNVDDIAFRDATNFKAREAAMQQVTTATHDLTDKSVGLKLAGEKMLGAAGAGLGFVSDKLDKDAESGENAAVSYGHLKEALSDLGNELEGNKVKTDIGAGLHGNMTDYTNDLVKLQDIAESVTPALESLGLTIDDLGHLHEQSQLDGILGAAAALQYQAVTKAIKEYNRNAGTVPGRTLNVVQALSALDAPLGNTEQAATDLSTALDDLFSPALDLSAATDQWLQALHDLDDGLAKNSGTLNEHTNAGRHNRELIRGLVTDGLTVLKAEANDPNVTSKQLSEHLEQMRTNIINVSTAAGISKKDIREYLAELNLTPKILHTFVDVSGTEMATKSIKRVEKALADIFGRPWTLEFSIREHTIHERNLRNNRVAGIGGHSVLDNADGHLIEYHADGGFSSFPSIGSQPPQIQRNQGPGGIVWAETGAGPWEAFVSGHPAKAPRSREIASEVVSRLGGSVQWFANGGMLGRGNLSHTVAHDTGDLSQRISELADQVAVLAIRQAAPLGSLALAEARASRATTGRARGGA